MATKYEEISKRLDIIRVLESLKFVVGKENDEDGNECIKCGSKVERLPMDKSFTPVFSDGYREMSGALATAVSDINTYAEQKLRPLIEHQQEAIKKLL